MVPHRAAARRSVSILVLALIAASAFLSGWLQMDPPGTAEDPAEEEEEQRSGAGSSPTSTPRTTPTPGREDEGPGWPMLRGGSGHTNAFPGADFAGGDVAWTHELGWMDAPAATDGDRVYGGSRDPCTAVIEGECPRTDQRFVAIDTTTGEISWEVATASGLMVGPVLGDGAVFVHAGSEVVALEQDDGTERWRILFGQSRTPAFADGLLFLTGNGVYAYDTGDGTQTWRWRPESGAASTTFSAATVVDDLVIVASRTHGTVALRSASGAVAWTADVHDATPVAAAADGATLVAFDGDDGLVALDAATGDMVWRITLPEPHGPALAVAGDTIIIQTEEHGLLGHALETGEGIWRTEADAFAGSHWAVADSLLTFSSTGVATSRALTDGRTITSWPLPEAPATAPIVVDRWAVYGTHDERLIAAGPAPKTPT